MKKQNNNLENALYKFNMMSEENRKELVNKYDVISFEKLEEKLKNEKVKPIEEKIMKIDEKISQIESYMDNIKDEEEKGKKYIELASLKKKKESLIKEKEKAISDVNIDINKQKKEKKLLEGYEKNKDSIVKVREYKSKITKNRNAKIQQKDKIAKEIEEVQEAGKKQIEELEGLKVKEVEALLIRKKEIEKKLENTEDLTNQEYNDLPVEKAEIEEKIKKLEKDTEKNIKIANNKTQEKIRILNNKIKEIERSLIGIDQAASKCDLAWKNLFLDKNWDEISVRAYEITKQNKPKVEEREDKPVKEEPKEDLETNGKDDVKKKFKPSEKAKSIINTAKEFFLYEEGFEKEDEDDEEISKGEEQEVEEAERPKNEVKSETQMVEYDEFAKKHPILASIKNFFKGFGTKAKQAVKELFGDEEIEKAEEVKVSGKENKDRDNFIEELRRYVENDKADKEKDYIEKHKAKAKVQEEQDR